MDSHKTLGAAVLLFLLPLLGSAQDASSRKVFFFDDGPHQAVSVDLKTGSILARSPELAAPSRIVRSPDGRRVFLLYAGEKPDAEGSSATKASAIILDADTCQQTAKVELGYGIGEWVFDRSGTRFALLSPGSGSGQESGWGEVTVLNVETGEVLGRSKLERPAHNLDLAPDGETLAVYLRGSTPEKGSQVRFFDSTFLQKVGTLSLDGAPPGPIASPDGSLLYFVEPGRPHRKRAKNVDGKVYVVSLTGRKLEKTLGAGSNPKGPWLDGSGRLLLLSDVPEDEGVSKPDGELRVISGTDVTRTLRVPWSPARIHFSGDSARAYVAGPLHIAAVDLATLEAVGKSDVDTGTIHDFVASADGKKALVSYGDSHLAVADLESHKLLNRMTTGRGGMRLLRAVGAADLGMSLASSSAARAAADRRGRDRTYYVERPAKGPTDGPLLVRPDGTVGYALNRSTEDVTIVDTKTGKSLDHVHVGSAATMFLLGEGSLIAACDNSEIYLLETQTQKLQEIKDLGKIQAVRYSPDLTRLLFLGTKKILIVDTATGKPSGEIAGLTKPILVGF